MKKNILSSLSIIVFILAIVACSKDRSILLPADTQPIEPIIPAVKTIKDYTFDGKDVEAFLSKLSNKSETKTIRNVSDLPFVAKNGTKIWIYASDLILPDGTKATYPFDLEVLELLTPKDMILNQKPTVSQGRLMTTGGELFIKATKGGKELYTSFFNSTNIVIPAKSTVEGMSLFYGESTGGFLEWYPEKERPRQQQGVPTQTGVLTRTDSLKEKSYVIFPTQIGWINCDKFSQFQGAKTKIKFMSAYPELKNIQKFLFFPDLKSVMQVYDGTSGDVPVGQSVKVICVAVTKDEQVFLFTKDIVVVDNQVVNIELKLATQKELTDYLQTLSF